MNASHPLEKLRASLVHPTEFYNDPSLYPRLSIVEVDGLLHVDWYGDPLDTPYFNLCRILATPGIAQTLDTVSLRTPDTGTNGTCSFNLDVLLAGQATFPRLRTFAIQQMATGDHNRKIVGRDGSEDGSLARLLAKAPVLDALVSPSAPDASFFEVDAPHLRALCVDAGYDTQDFVANLARSTRLTGLRNLEFGEYNETYLHTFPQGCTPFDDYRDLFRSTAFAPVRTFTWRHPRCTPEQIASLKALRPGLSLKIVRFSHDWA